MAQEVLQVLRWTEKQKGMHGLSLFGTELFAIAHNGQTHPIFVAQQPTANQEGCPDPKSES